MLGLKLELYIQVVRMILEIQLCKYKMEVKKRQNFSRHKFHLQKKMLWLVTSTHQHSVRSQIF